MQSPLFGPARATNEICLSFHSIMRNMTHTLVKGGLKRTVPVTCRNFEDNENGTGDMFRYFLADALTTIEKSLDSIMSNMSLCQKDFRKLCCERKKKYIYLAVKSWNIPVY